MEACGGAHHWAHAITELGHAVRLMSPALVAPYRTGNKHDRNDADAICEAVRRPRMRFVAVKECGAAGPAGPASGCARNC
jgi:transposase